MTRYTIPFLAPQAIGSVEKWESCFWISTFPPSTFTATLPQVGLWRNGENSRRGGGNVEIVRFDFQGLWAWWET